jgi:mannose-6-phosphate isomerase-like protein (cupin superfamily)
MLSRTRILVSIVAIPCIVASAFAAVRRPPVRIDYVPAFRFDEVRGFAKAMGLVGGTVAVGWDAQTSYMVVRRTVESEVEEHSRWDDVLLVRAGTGAIVFGARARGARLLAPGELRGGTLTSREARVLHVGDVARIPAGVPHTFVPSGAEPWELLIIKVRRPDRPLRRRAD